MKKNYSFTPAAGWCVWPLRLAIFCFAFCAPFISHAQRELLKDINKHAVEVTDPYSDLKSSSQQVYIVKNTGLYVTKDTAVVLLKMFNAIGKLTINGSKAYFAADDGSGMELWMSNGTAASTVRLKDIVPGTGGSNPQQITVMNSYIFFSAQTPANGRELWKTNGTSAGTVMVKDILAGTGSSNPEGLVSMNNMIFFSANDGQHGYELWSSIGTAESTTIVKDITPETRVSSSPKWMTNVYGTLYFSADDKVSGEELWRSDGSAAGTYLVKDIRPGSPSADIENLINLNGTLIFTAHDGIHGDEPWKSDGTEAGTMLLKDLTPGRGGSNSTDSFSYPMDNFTIANNVLYFIAAGSANGNPYNYTIVRTNGTEAGTFVIANAYAHGIGRLRPNFTYLNGNTYFFNGTENEGYGLYRIDYKNTVHAVRPLGYTADYYDAFNPEMVKFNGALYLTVYSQDAGWKLMKLLPSGESTIIDESLHISNGSYPKKFVTVGNYVYFFTTGNYPYYTELWRTDGTPDGTIRLREIPWDPHEMVVIDDKVYFSAGETLLVTQGTPETTHEIIAFAGNITVTGLTAVNGLLYFHNGSELWKTDGTATGTVKVRTLTDIITVNNVNGKAFVLNHTAAGGLELWRTNATGMLLVKTIRSSYATGPVKYLSAVVGNWLYFIANDGEHGNEVWRSDGTAFGTVMIGDLNGYDPTTYNQETDIVHMVAFNGKVYVSASTNEGWQLLSVTNKGGFTTIATLPQVTYSIVDEYRLYLFAYSPNGDSFLQLWEYDLLKAGQFTFLADVGYGKPSHADVDGFLYYSTENSGGPKQISACGIKDIDVGGYAHPLGSVGHDLIFGGEGPNIGVEPFAYHNIPAISEDCNADGNAALTARETKSIFSAFPNPTVNDFAIHIDGKEGEFADVMVYDATGLPVETFRGVNVNTEIHVGSGWPRGLYYVKVFKSGEVYTGQIGKK
jgi:ELWxxDGT repeat protein